MRIAVVADIHGNLAALEAVVADLKAVSPDLVVHGGDLVVNGARPAEVIDLIRDLRWPGVIGNTDEMLWRPDRFEEQTARAPRLTPLLRLLFGEASPYAADALGEDRLNWLRSLPLRWSGHALTVVHASPDDLWRAPSLAASDDELVNTYDPLRSQRVAYGHIHRSYIRRLPRFHVANTGSVSLSHDGDPRAAYALIDDDQIVIRRVQYDIEQEVAMLTERGHPNVDWLAHTLRIGAYTAPEGAV